MLPPIPSPSAHDCPNCGANVDDAKLKYCPHCGAALKQPARLTAGRIIGLVALAICALGSAGVGACSLVVINSGGELPELGWIGFWPALIGLLFSLFGIVRILRRK